MLDAIMEAHRGAGEAVEDFRSTMRRVAATVTLLSTSWRGRRFGMTATSVTSVSFAPPSLLTIINQTASIYDPLLASGHFCVNVLFRNQGELCDAFSGRRKGEERFQVGNWASEDGIPFLRDAQANIFCEVDRVVPYGTHAVVIGKVCRARAKLEVSPLLYLDGLARNLAIDAAR